MYVPLVRSTGHSALHIYIKRTFSTLTAKAVSCVEPILILFFIQFHHYPFLSQPSVEMPISQICLSHPLACLGLCEGGGARRLRRDRRVVYHAERNPLADLTEQITMAAPQEHSPFVAERGLGHADTLARTGHRPWWRPLGRQDSQGLSVQSRVATRRVLVVRRIKRTALTARGSDTRGNADRRGASSTVHLPAIGADIGPAERWLGSRAEQALE